IDSVGRVVPAQQSISGRLPVHEDVARCTHRDRFSQGPGILSRKFRKGGIMSRVRTAGSFFWGVMLLAVGALLLARNLGYAIPLWDGIARYWPAVLILWGIFKLIDYFRYRQSGVERQLFSAGEIVILIMIILAGSAITVAANLSPDLADIFHVKDI